MASIAGHPIEQFTPHDFRRTARSNTKRLKVDYETAEAMLNHVKRGLERTYDLYELEEEKRAWFLKWEQEIATIAARAGVAEALGVPSARPSNPNRYMITVQLPQCARVQPTVNLTSLEPRAVAIFAQSTPKLVFTRKSGRAALPEPIDSFSGDSSELGKFISRNQVRK